ncbi:MAG: ABC transporter ATP-binding protein [Thermomicrobiales bacterium]
MTALACTRVAKRFGLVQAVDGVDFEVAEGDIPASLGPSGCGKTTALRMVAGFEDPDRGSIAIDDVVVADDTRSLPPERRNVGMVFQDGALFPHLSVAKNVGFGIRNGPKDALVEDALRLVGLEGAGSRMPHQLSGGQQQRVALARALAPKPSLLLLDEPFSSLDAALRRRLQSDVREIILQTGVTALLVTHDQEEALSMADRVAVMWEGRILQIASPDELYLRPVSRRVAEFVGEAQFLPGSSEGRVVTCALGRLPSVNSASGPVDVMVRPEILRLAPSSQSEGVTALVRARAFFGHDQMLDCLLSDGTVIHARTNAYAGFQPGEEVRITVRGAVLTFPPASPE